VVRRTYEWLAEQQEDAAELVALLAEAAPRLGVAAAAAAARAPASRTPSRPPPEPGAAERLAAAAPMPAGAGPRAGGAHGARVRRSGCRGGVSNQGDSAVCREGCVGRRGCVQVCAAAHSTRMLLP